MPARTGMVIRRPCEVRAETVPPLYAVRSGMSSVANSRLGPDPVGVLLPF